MWRLLTQTNLTLYPLAVRRFVSSFAMVVLPEPSTPVKTSIIMGRLAVRGCFTLHFPLLHINLPYVLYYLVLLFSV